MIADHNETKAFQITFFPETHVEQVEIVAKNRYLKIGILKQSKIRALGVVSKVSKWSEKIGSCSSTPDRKENSIPTSRLFVLTGRLRTDFQGLLIWGFSK